MAATTQDRALPLPKGWSRRVRSAVVQAISLAQFALTSARSVAANNLNARIRLKEENDRLRQEIALLREEVRIKDARMARIPAQRKPHYPPTERLAILELRAARGWSASSPSASVTGPAPVRRSCSSPETGFNALPFGSGSLDEGPEQVDR